MGDSQGEPRLHSRERLEERSSRGAAHRTAQGKRLWEVVEVGKKTRAGIVLEALLHVIEDESLRWWCVKGDGAPHLLQGAACKEFNAKQSKHFHSDVIWALDDDDLRIHRILWWQVGRPR